MTYVSDITAVSDLGRLADLLENNNNNNEWPIYSIFVSLLIILNFHCSTAENDTGNTSSNLILPKGCKMKEPEKEEG